MTTIITLLENREKTLNHMKKAPIHQFVDRMFWSFSHMQISPHLVIFRTKMKRIISFTEAY